MTTLAAVWLCSIWDVCCCSEWLCRGLLAAAADPGGACGVCGSAGVMCAHPLSSWLHGGAAWAVLCTSTARPCLRIFHSQMLQAGGITCNCRTLHLQGASGLCVRVGGALARCACAAARVAEITDALFELGGCKAKAMAMYSLLSFDTHAPRVYCWCQLPWCQQAPSYHVLPRVVCGALRQHSLLQSP